MSLENLIINPFTLFISKPTLVVIMSLKSLFNSFITSGIKSPDLEIINRFKVLNVFLCILILLSPCLGLFYSFIGADLLFYTCTGAGILGISVSDFSKDDQKSYSSWKFCLFCPMGRLFDH